MIYHISTVHISTDTRLQKYIKSRSDMKLICFNRGEKKTDNVIFFKKYSIIGRLLAIIFMPLYCIKYLIKEDTVVLHDPELIIAGYILKKMYGNKMRIIFDAHENIIQDISHKYWLNKYVRKLLVVIFGLILKYLLPKYDLITTVTDPLVKFYSKYNKNVKLLPNLPFNKIEFYKSKKNNNDILELKHIYVGSISMQRGIYTILSLSKILKNKIIMVGSFVDKKLMHHVQTLPEWKNIDYKGYINNDELGDILKDCDVGILLLEDINTFRDSLPVKIFDYAQYGLIIEWTGSSRSFYSKYVMMYENIFLGENLKEAEEIIKSKLSGICISKPITKTLNDDWVTSMNGIY